MGTSQGWAGHRQAVGHGASARVLVDGKGPLVTLTVSHLLGHGVRALHGAWAAEAAQLALSGHLGVTSSQGRRRPPDSTRAILPPDAALDVVVLVEPGPIDPGRARPWVASGIPHLPVEVRGDVVVVGPLVAPGRSSCLMCHEFTRQAHRQQGWVNPGAPPGAIEASGGVTSVPQLASVPLLASALTAGIVLDVLAGDLSMAGVSTEITAPVPEFVHRHWPRHPWCACGGTRRDLPSPA